LWSLQGYRASNAYIVTQMPLPHTVIDLWRMIYEHKCGTIVMLNHWDENDTVGELTGCIFTVNI